MSTAIELAKQLEELACVAPSRLEVAAELRRLAAERAELAAKLDALAKQEPVGVFSSGHGLSSVIWRDDVTVGELEGRSLYAAPIPAPVADEREALLRRWVQFGAACGSDLPRHLIAETRAALQPAQSAQPAVVPGGWHMVCGDWRDELVALHDSKGHIVSGLTADQARALIAAHCGAAALAAAPQPDNKES